MLEYRIPFYVVLCVAIFSELFFVALMSLPALKYNKGYRTFVWLYAGAILWVVGPILFVLAIIMMVQMSQVAFPYDGLDVFMLGIVGLGVGICFMYGIVRSNTASVMPKRPSE